MDALAKSPLCLGRREFRSRMSLVGGDGTVAHGGPQRKNPGIRACENTWRYAHPPAALLAQEQLLIKLVLPPLVDAWTPDDQRVHGCTEWHKLHREDFALTRAIAACPMAAEALALRSIMGHTYSLWDTICLRGARPRRPPRARSFAAQLQRLHSRHAHSGGVEA